MRFVKLARNPYDWDEKKNDPQLELLSLGPGVSEPTLQMDKGKGFQWRVFAAEEEQGTPQGHPKGLAAMGRTPGYPRWLPKLAYPAW